MGIFWKRTSGIAASLGMLAGIGVLCYYMSVNQPLRLRGVFTSVAAACPLPLSGSGFCNLFGHLFSIPLGFAVIFPCDPHHPGPKP